jgi:hypothetical protein
VFGESETGRIGLKKRAKMLVTAPPMQSKDLFGRVSFPSAGFTRQALPLETVRKVSLGSKPEPYGTMKRREKTLILLWASQTCDRDATQHLFGQFYKVLSRKLSLRAARVARLSVLVL